ncbi:MAG: 4-alpha-glucanotransferase [Eubacteriales bacterium]|nr:4-alpha-glucanotransferase [Eubacteriales bacterium]
MERSSGIILHITSLEAPYGIGTMGACAYRFADFLKRAGQSYWQTLPLGPTGYGDSPYQSFSSFAGNPVLIDLDILVDDGLLNADDLKEIAAPSDPARVAYEVVKKDRKQLLRKAYSRRSASESREAQDFFTENAEWLDDYAFFMAIKEHFNADSWQEWPEDLRRRRPDALKRYRHKLQEDIEYHGFVQYLFYKQWDALKTYVNNLGIKIIGDLPIYVAEDSADVWAQPGLFDLDGDLRMRHVAGVPPDYFSPDGQRWGNPLYHWPAHAASGYEWWLARIGAVKRVADAVRIDHFRGFHDYWSVPVGSATARNGRWRRGPGLDLVRALQKTYPELPVIAEDLGLLSKGAMNFVQDSGYPGMKVLQFAFDASRPGRGAPHTFSENSVCYTGTHDNTTTAGWFKEGMAADVKLAERYFGLNESEGKVAGMIRGGMACPSRLFMVPMQDWLGLDERARMNTPGTIGANWQWRMLPGEPTALLASRIASITCIFGRKSRRRRNGKI